MAQETEIQTALLSLMAEIRAEMKKPKSSQVDFKEIETLTASLAQSVSATTHLTEGLSTLAQEVRNPIVSQKKITIEFRSTKIIVLFVSMFLTLVVMGVIHYYDASSNYDLMSNDLKYRYIKMKGEASPKQISYLEELFEVNRDDDKISQMEKDVQEYEKAIREKILLEEQTRLRQLDAERLNDKTKTLKEK